MEDWTPPAKDTDVPWTPPEKDTWTPPAKDAPVPKKNLADAMFANAGMIPHDNEKPALGDPGDVLDKAAAASEAVAGAPVISHLLDAASRPVRATETLVNTRPTPFWWPKNAQPGSDDSRKSPVLDQLAQVAMDIPIIGQGINALGNMGRNVIEGHLPVGGEGKSVLPDVVSAVSNLKDLPENATPEQRAAFEAQTAAPWERNAALLKDVGRTLTERVGGDEIERLPNQIASKPSFMTKDGTDWDEAARHFMDFAGREGSRIPIDPVMSMTGGLTPEARAAQAARATATIERGMGLAGPVAEEAAAGGAKSLAEANFLKATGQALPAEFKTAEEGARWMAPSRGAQIAAGNVEFLGMPVPPALSFVGKAVDALESVNIGMKGMSIVEPNVRHAANLLQKATLDKAKFLLGSAYKEQVVPKYAKAIQTGLQEPDIRLISDVAETLDPFGNLRAAPELAEQVAGRGFKVQQALPADVAKMGDLALESERVAGLQHFQPKIKEALEKMSTYTPEQFAAAYDLMQAGNRFTQNAREIYGQLTGKELTPLNAKILSLPPQINFALSEVRLRRADPTFYQKPSRDINTNVLAARSGPVTQEPRQVLGVWKDFVADMDRPDLTAFDKANQKVMELKARIAKEGAGEPGTLEKLSELQDEYAKLKLSKAFQEEVQGRMPTDPLVSHDVSFNKQSISPRTQKGDWTGAGGDNALLSKIDDIDRRLNALLSNPKENLAADNLAAQATLESINKDLANPKLSAARRAQVELEKRELLIKEGTVDPEAMKLLQYRNELVQQMEKPPKDKFGGLTEPATKGYKKTDEINANPKSVWDFASEGDTPILDRMDALKREMDKVRSEYTSKNVVHDEFNQRPAELITEATGDKMRPESLRGQLRRATAERDALYAKVKPMDFGQEGLATEGAATTGAKATEPDWYGVLGNEEGHDLFREQLSTPQRVEDAIAAIEKGDLTSLDQIKQYVNNRDVPIAHEDMARLENALKKEQGIAVRKYNAVPAYRPGRLSAVARKDFKALRKTGQLPERVVSGSGLESAERSYAFNEKSGIEGVKTPVYRSEQEISRGMGTAATEGKGINGLNNWFYQYLTPQGFKNLYEDMIQIGREREFFEPNSYKALERLADKELPRAASNRMLDQAMLNWFDHTPEPVWKRVVDAAGEDTLMVGKPGENHAAIYGRLTESQKKAFNLRNDRLNDALSGFVDSNGKWYSRDEALAAQKGADPYWGKHAVGETLDKFRAAFKVPSTLEDLQAVYKEAGGKGSMEHLIKPDVLEKLKKNETTVFDEFKHGDTNAPSHVTPFNRDKVILDDKPVYIHGDVAREIAGIKALGADPYQFARYLGSAAPFYAHTLQAWKKLATYAGPQFIAYNIRNQIGDTMRMYMGGLVDGATYGEWGRIIQKLPEYMRTGDLNLFKDLQIATKDGVIDGAQAMRLVEENGVRGGTQIASDVIGGMKPSVIASVEKQMLAEKLGAGVKKSKEYIAQKWENLKTLQQAREEANRISGFFTRLRAGDTAIEAGMRVNKTLFDYSRLSPAANFLRQSGLVPFISWQSKNIPLTIQFALTHPGQFAGIMRALDMVSDGSLPESMLPNYLKGKHQIPLRYVINDKGERELSMMSDSGVIPLTDFTELAAGPGRYIMNQLGPILKPLFLLKEMTDEQDEAKHTTSDYVDTAAQGLLGRPYQTGKGIYDWARAGGQNPIDPQTGEQRGTAESIGRTLFSPIKTVKVNLDKQQAISLNSAKKAFTSSAAQLKEANANLAHYEQAAQAAAALANNANAISPNDPDFMKLNDRAKQAQELYQREWDRLQAMAKDAQKAGATFERMKLTP